MRPFRLSETIKNLAYISVNLVSFCRRSYAPSQIIQAYQLRQIQRLVWHAYEVVPLYREKYRRAGIHPKDIRSLEDYQHLPTITKDEIITAYPNGTLARGTILDQCLISKSSGSSGKTINVVHKGDAVGIQGLAMFRMFNMGMRYLPWHKLVYIYTSRFPAGSALGLYPMYFIPTLNNIEDTIRKLEQICPDLIMCYPSHLKEIIHRLPAKANSRIRPKAIWVGSEMSTQDERDYLGDRFGCPVYDEYSMEELTRIAAQCKEKRYHLFEDICYVEILHPESNQIIGPGVQGEVVGTYLHNYTMPFIRYRTGDYAILSSESCPCGRTFRTLNGIIGRKNDNFPLPSGRVLSSGFLLDAAYSLLLGLDADIVDFCLVQEQKDYILLEVVPGERFSKETEKQIEHHLTRLMGEPVTLVVRQVGKLYKTEAGKRNPIISKVDG